MRFYSTCTFSMLLATGMTYSDPVMRLWPRELLYTDAQLPVSHGIEFGVDGTFSTIKKNDASFYTFNSHGFWTFRYTGTVNNPIPTTGTDAGFPKCNEALYPNDPQFHTGRIAPFILNMYKAENGDLLGFVHLEDSRACLAGYDDGTTCPAPNPPTNFHCGDHRYRIGLAYSQNQGETWKYLGDILTPSIDGPWKNIGGVPFVVADGYFYTYFNEFAMVGGSESCHVGIARAPVSEVLSAALAGTVSPWRKRNMGNMANNGFNEPGIGGSASSSVPAHPSYPMGCDDASNNPNKYDVHSDAVYSRAVKRYYLLVNVYRRANLLYSSTNGLDWGNPIIVDNTVAHPNVPNAEVQHAFPTITSYAFGTDDLRETGREFYIQYPYKPIMMTGNATAMYGYDDIYRRKVSTTSDIVPFLRYW